MPSIITASRADPNGKGLWITINGDDYLVPASQLAAGLFPSDRVMLNSFSAPAAQVQSVAIGGNVSNAGQQVSVGFNAIGYGLQAVSVGYGSFAGGYTVAIGGSAFANVSQGVSIGSNTLVTSDYSIALGSNATDLGATRVVMAHGNNGYQSFKSILRGQTTSATPVVLTTDGAAASAANQNALNNANSCQVFRGRVIGQNSAHTAAYAAEFSGAIRRAGANTTTLVAAVTPVLVATDGALSTCAVTVTADTTNDALQVAVSGVAATTIRWTCVIDAAYCGV